MDCEEARKKKKNGGAEGIRTLDLLDAIEARSQLRHGPTELTKSNISAGGGSERTLRRGPQDHATPAGLYKS